MLVYIEVQKHSESAKNASQTQALLPENKNSIFQIDLDFLTK